jgi:hypothetical protein
MRTQVDAEDKLDSVELFYNTCKHGTPDAIRYAWSIVCADEYPQQISLDMQFVRIQAIMYCILRGNPAVIIRIHAMRFPVKEFVHGHLMSSMMHRHLRVGNGKHEIPTQSYKCLHKLYPAEVEVFLPSLYPFHRQLADDLLREGFAWRKLTVFGFASAFPDDMHIEESLKFILRNQHRADAAFQGNPIYLDQPKEDFEVSSRDLARVLYLVHDHPHSQHITDIIAETHSIQIIYKEPHRPIPTKDDIVSCSVDGISYEPHQ